MFLIIFEKVFFIQIYQKMLFYYATYTKKEYKIWLI